MSALVDTNIPITGAASTKHNLTGSLEGAILDALWTRPLEWRFEQYHASIRLERTVIYGSHSYLSLWIANGPSCLKVDNYHIGSCFPWYRRGRIRKLIWQALNVARARQLSGRTP